MIRGAAEMKPVRHPRLVRERDLKRRNIVGIELALSVWEGRQPVCLTQCAEFRRHQPASRRAGRGTGG